MLKNIFLIVSVILLSGCASQNNTTVVKKTSEHRWLLNPYTDNDKITTIGYSKMHFKGVIQK